MTNCDTKFPPTRVILRRSFRMISPELQHLRRYFFLQMISESRFRPNGVKNSLLMTVDSLARRSLMKGSNCKKIQTAKRERALEALNGTFLVVIKKKKKYTNPQTHVGFICVQLQNELSQKLKGAQVF